jgi:hypothetical protein
MVINKKMADNILLLENKTNLLPGLIGIFLRALSRIKNNTLHIKPAKLGIRYTSSIKSPISHK